MQLRGPSSLFIWNLPTCSLVLFWGTPNWDPLLCKDKKNGEVITNPFKMDWEEAGFEPGKQITGRQILIQEIWSDPDNSSIVWLYTVLTPLVMLLFPKGKGSDFLQFLVFTNIVHLWWKDGPIVFSFPMSMYNTLKWTITENDDECPLKENKLKPGDTSLQTPQQSTWQLSAT